MERIKTGELKKIIAEADVFQPILFSEQDQALILEKARNQLPSALWSFLNPQTRIHIIKREELLRLVRNFANPRETKISVLPIIMVPSKISVLPQISVGPKILVPAIEGSQDPPPPVPILLNPGSCTPNITSIDPGPRRVPRSLINLDALRGKAVGIQGSMEPQLSTDPLSSHFRSFSNLAERPPHRSAGPPWTFLLLRAFHL